MLDCNYCNTHYWYSIYIFRTKTGCALSQVFDLAFNLPRVKEKNLRQKNRIRIDFSYVDNTTTNAL